MSSTTSSVSSTSSDTTYTESTSSGRSRYYGLASDLDVDSIVTSMLSGDQAKINVQQKKEQQLEWKQEAYQSITTSLRTFEETYLELTSDNSMLSSNSYSSYTGTSSSAVLTVSGNSEASAGSHTIEIYQSAVAASVAGAALSPDITGTVDTSTVNPAGTSFYVTVDGVKKQISFDSDETTFSVDTLNDKLKAAFGTDTDGNCKVVASVNEKGYLVIGSGDTYSSKISVSSPSSDDALAEFGIASGTSNRIKLGSSTSGSGTSISSLFGGAVTADADGNFDVTVNGTKITLNTGDNLTQVMSAVNTSDAGVTMSYDSISDKVTVTSSVGGAAGGVSLSDSSGFFDALLGADGSRTVTDGRDAILSVDGTKITRSSNSFTANGITYSINQTVNPDDADSPVEADIKLTNDTSDAETLIKNFVSAYNTLISDINSQISEKPDSDYYPLTDAQKEDMTDDEITKWETKAKAGILFSDSTLNDVVSSMRELVSQSVTTSSGDTISLADIGITESTDYTQKGQLVIDETTLKKALESNTNDVSDLFSQSSDTTYYDQSSGAQSTRRNEEGIAYRLQDVINDATNSTSGSLIELAGMPNESSATQNSIYKQLEDVKDTIESLQSKYDSDRDRYYDQFTTLETFLSEMNSQSSFLDDYLSTSTS